MTDLSVIILSYNTKAITGQCLQSLFDTLSASSDINTEIIVVDNASSDGSVEMLHEFQKLHHIPSITWKFIFNKENIGYPKGNNLGMLSATGTYILLLNSDVIIEHIDFASLLHFMNSDKNVGVLTVMVNLPSGGIDPASHRGLPTLWNSFCYFTKLEKIFGHIPYIGKLFGGYHLTHLDKNSIHEIDSPAGAFYLTRKSIIDKVGGFDEQFFMYGEDLDLSYRIKMEGYKIVYYPLYYVTHLKRSSGLDKKDPVIQQRTRRYFYDSMRIFFQKHYAPRYPAFFNELIYWIIGLKSKI